MAGTVLENLSNKKIITLLVLSTLVLIVMFLIGGIIAPYPSHVESVLGTKCIIPAPIAPGQADPVWHIPRGKGNNPVNCHPVEDLRGNYVKEHHVGPNQVVFAFQSPLPRSGYALDYSRWMATLMGVLNLDVIHSKARPMKPEVDITLEVKLGYRNKWDPEDQWTLLANATTVRKLKCDTDEKIEEGFSYNCDLINLFELGSLHHDYYLLNLRLPVNPEGSNLPPTNEELGLVEDIWLVAINQNGGFTKVYVAVKTFFFPLVLAITIWYWNRIVKLPRPSSLLERMLFILLLSLIILTFPLEYVTLFVEIRAMLLIQDLRQGLYNAAIAVFWLVFCGEHRMDEPVKKTFFCYWKVLLPVILGCLSLLIFDMCERGVQLVNPFFSIWGTTSGIKAAHAFITFACVCSACYFAFLVYSIRVVWKNISFKKSALATMSASRRLYYQGIIFRFKFMMGVTLACAGSTIVTFIMTQLSENQWKWNEEISLHLPSALLIGQFALWNLYAIGMAILFAPSHKTYPPSAFCKSPMLEVPKVHPIDKLLDDAFSCSNNSVDWRYN